MSGTHLCSERRRLARAEAAVWVVRLHGSRRSPEFEAGFRHWLAAHPENGEEFERVTAVWEAAPHASVAGLPRVRGRQPSPKGKRWALAAVLVMACCAGLWLLSHSSRDTTYVTGIGEQRLIPLEDGSRIALNSDSRVKIDYLPAVRRVYLIRGEAFFEVAHNPQRPFVVAVGGQQVTALGTSFEVRYDADRVDVILMEGKVSVTPAAEGTRSPSQTSQNAGKDSLSTASQRGFVMVPGERLTIAKGVAPKVDEPRMDAITAWRRGEVMLDDTPLADAIVEMNRYNRSALVVDENDLSNLRISGIYHTGDSVGFAQTVASLYGLRVTEAGEQIHLSSAVPITH
jgi:transmembrane sensor